MNGQIIINGTTYDIPEDDDFTLGEIAEAQKLTDDLGDLGETIATLWIVKHREDPSFTIHDAKQIKIGQYDAVKEEKPEVPLDGSGGSSGNGSSGRPRPATRGGSGRQRSAKSTA